MRLIKLKVKEVLGKDVDVAIGEFNTDAVVSLNLNDLAKTEGIVSGLKLSYLQSFDEYSILRSIIVTFLLNDSDFSHF